jgi:hypothetical protein
LVYGLLQLSLTQRAELQGKPFPTQSEHDFAALSKVFFMKDVYLLEFQWLVLVRGADKMGWQEQ